MLFNTPDFVVFFVVVLATISIIKNRRFQHLFLLFASYFFFFYSSNYLIVLLIASTILDFYVGKEIYVSDSLRRKKIFLMMSLAGNLGLLGFFKYADFGIEQFNNLAIFLGSGTEIPLLNLVLPIGISFYTFQTLSYSIDIYRGQLTPSKSLREFAIFVSFFPCLVAGPIIRAKHFLPQLREKMETSGGYKLKQVLIHDRNLKFGISLMALGFLKKMFFADNIAPLVNDIFASPIGEESFSIILGTIGFGVQIYADFSGYSDIAIGAALIIGIIVKENFNKPFFAKSPSDFWNRWHISLSSWVRDYMYLPLVFKRRKSIVAVFFSLIFTMTVIGFWHGAGWNFVIFGLLHGIFMASHRLLITKFPSLGTLKFFKTKLGIIFSILVTQYLIFFAFISFRVQDFSEMVYSMEKYVFWDFATTKTLEIMSTNKFAVFLIGLFFILHYFSYKKSNLIEKIASLKLRYWFLVLLSIMLAIFFFYDGNPEDFIYFKF